MEALTALLARGRHAVDAAVRPVAAGRATTSSAGCSGPARECEGSKLVPIEANGSPAWGQYQPRSGRWLRSRGPCTVLETQDGKVTGINSFLDTERLFPLFGLPPHLD